MVPLRQQDLRRLTRFFGTLLVINIAIGVVTGLVQEFQFGMNWSEYSRFVGDVFGAPLAMEGLAAFFLESTFLGLWLFGWNVLPRKDPPGDRLAGRGRAALSAAFIMAANSWMQHPVGYKVNPTTGRPELTSTSALFTNPVFIWGYAHVLLASLVTGAWSCWPCRPGTFGAGKTPRVVHARGEAVDRRPAAGLDPPAWASAATSGSSRRRTSR